MTERRNEFLDPAQGQYRRRHQIRSVHQGKHLPIRSRENTIATMNSPARQFVAHSMTALCLSALIFLACGCSSFHRAWREAEKRPVPENSIEGRWEGRWVSDANGHNGKLLCLMSRQTDGQYTAWFRATYLKILRFSYAVTLEVEARDGAWLFRGEEDLGKMAGGVYHYAGNATSTNFHSTYHSKYDHGVFEMYRPDCE